MNNHEKFLKAIKDKKIVKVKFDSHEKGVIERECVPFDYGPWKKKPSGDRYHFLDLNSPDGEHNLSILPEQLISLEITNHGFDPAEHVKWTPKWFIARDWGAFS